MTKLVSRAEGWVERDLRKTTCTCCACKCPHMTVTILVGKKINHCKSHIIAYRFKRCQMREAGQYIQEENYSGHYQLTKMR